jgi:hypothetical protein
MVNYNHPRANIAIDVVAAGYLPTDKVLRILLIYRENEKKWALPGHFMRSSTPSPEGFEFGPGAGEDAETVAQAFREALQIKATMGSRSRVERREKKLDFCINYKAPQDNGKPMTDADFTAEEFALQLPIRSAINRDEDRIDKDSNPRRIRVISLPFLTMLKPHLVWADVMAYYECAWVPLDWIIQDNMNNKDYNGLSKLFEKNNGTVIKSPIPRTEAEEYHLAFDHADILASAIIALRQYARCYPCGREILDEHFSMSSLCHLYEVIFDRTIDQANCRKVFIKNDSTDSLLIPTNKKEGPTGRKQSNLLKFNDDIYNQYKQTPIFRFPFF